MLSLVFLQQPNLREEAAGGGYVMTENEIIDLMGSAGIFSQDALAHSHGMLCHTLERCSRVLADLEDRSESCSSEARQVQVEEAVAGMGSDEKKACKELLLSLLKSRPSWGSLYRDTLCSLLRQCVGPAQCNKEIWKEAWATNREAVMYGIQDMCRQEPSCVEAFLNALHPIVDLGEALHICDDVTFKVDFALAAHNAGHLSFSKWMSGAVAREGGEAVALECINLATKCYEGEDCTRSVRIRTDILLPLAKSLDQLQYSSGECCAAYERLRSVSRGRLLGGVGGQPVPPAPGAAAQGASASGIANNSGVPVAAGPGAPGAAVGELGQQQGQQQQSALFAADIEEEANSHFQRIYTNKLQIEGVIQMLKGFKTSSIQVCLVH